MFEATHESAPKYKGQNKVNPIAMMLSGVLMLRHLSETEAADRTEAAIAAVIAEGQAVTYDMKPTRDDPTAVGTSQVADAVIAKLGGRAGPPRAHASGDQEPLCSGPSLSPVVTDGETCGGPVQGRARDDR